MAQIKYLTMTMIELVIYDPTLSTWLMCTRRCLQQKQCYRTDASPKTNKKNHSQDHKQEHFINTETAYIANFVQKIYIHIFSERVLTK